MIAFDLPRPPACGSSSRPARWSCWCRPAPRPTSSGWPRPGGRFGCPAWWTRSRAERGDTPRDRSSAPSKTGGRSRPSSRSRRCSSATTPRPWPPRSTGCGPRSRRRRAAGAGDSGHRQGLRGDRQEGRRHGERPRGGADQGHPRGPGEDRTGGAPGRLRAGGAAGAGGGADRERAQRRHHPAEADHGAGGPRADQAARAAPAVAHLRGRPRQLSVFGSPSSFKALAARNAGTIEALIASSFPGPRVPSLARRAPAELEVAEPGDRHLAPALQLRGDDAALGEEEIGDLPGARSRDPQPLGDGLDHHPACSRGLLEGRGARISPTGRERRKVAGRVARGAATCYGGAGAAREPRLTDPYPRRASVA